MRRNEDTRVVTGAGRDRAHEMSTIPEPGRSRNSISSSLPTVAEHPPPSTRGVR
jgi:hypothetical protein